MKRQFGFVLLNVIFIFLALPGVLQAQDVVELVLEGKTGELQRGLDAGTWTGTVEEELVKALLSDEGFATASSFERIVNDPSASSGIKTIARFHLYGFARITGNVDRAEELLAELRAEPELARKLFGGEIPESVPHVVGMPEPEPETEGPGYSVQIGAFGNRSNADRLAAQQRNKGYTAEVVPLRRGSKLLHAVWVGIFSSREDAVDFGKRVYGVEGKDFYVMEREE